MNVIIGIDNGISGAIVAISAHTGAFIAALPMPTQKGATGNEINVIAAKQWIAEIAGTIGSIKCVAIEQPVGSKSYKAAVSMAGSFHALRSICDLSGLRMIPIPARTWQKFMLGKIASGDSKKSALQKAMQLWPDETFLAGKRSKVPHNGIVDASLIAEYARLKNL